MTRFPSAGHFASWAGMCSGNHESTGKRLSGCTRKGSSWLRKLLVEAAHAAAHTKNTYLSAQYHRLAARCGKKKAMKPENQGIASSEHDHRDRRRIIVEPLETLQALETALCGPLQEQFDEVLDV